MKCWCRRGEQYDAAEVTLITPRVTGGSAGNVQLRTEELNRRLQRTLNPAAAGSLGAIVAGDPVVCVKNRRADDVWNGTSGVAVTQGGKLQLRVHEVEQRIVDCIEDCELAYALVGAQVPGVAEPRYRARRAPVRRPDADAPAALHRDLARAGAVHLPGSA